MRRPASQGGGAQRHPDRRGAGPEVPPTRDRLTAGGESHSAAAGDGRARRVRLTVCYDGTAYGGFQVQPDGPTIQSVMETALGRLLDEPVRLRAAGRTDAGVHAREQVVDFADSGRRSLETVVRGGNALLPPDVRIRSAEEAPRSFDARRHAKSKEYRYFLWLNRVASPFVARYAWHIEKPLDIPAMREGFSHVVGEHDFSSFRGQGCTARTPVRTILRAGIAWQAGPDIPAAMEGAGMPASLLYLHLAGTGFLRHMVRNIVGTLVEVGRGNRPPERIRELLALRDRAQAGPTAPARGLFLWRVEYQADPSQAHVFP